MSSKLFIGNLSRDTTSQKIRDLFSVIGAVEWCQLIEDQLTGQPKSFAFLEMHSIEAACAAKEKFNGHHLHGQALEVNEAKLSSDWQTNERW
jgi:RNA recognition motif-containing protein